MNGFTCEAAIDKTRRRQSAGAERLQRSRSNMRYTGEIAQYKARLFAPSVKKNINLFPIIKSASRVL